MKFLVCGSLGYNVIRNSMTLGNKPYGGKCLCARATLMNPKMWGSLRGEVWPGLLFSQSLLHWLS